MWAVPKIADDELELDDLVPETVLDFYDGPVLFTVRDRLERLLLVYQCGVDEHNERFVLVPTSPRQVADLENSRVTLREALTGQGWTWLVDQDRAGKLSTLGLIDTACLPKDALPEPGVFLRARASQ